MLKIIALSFIVFGSFNNLAISQNAMPAMSSHKEDATAKAMTTMHEAMMNAPMTGEPDRDFVVMMIPHHQGAIDMAKIYLKSGTNPEIEKMAENIIQAQTDEIKKFKLWMEKHPSKTVQK